MLDENTRLKNNVKVLKERNRSLTDNNTINDGNDTTLSERNPSITDNNSINDGNDTTLREFKTFQQDYLDFKKYVCEQITTIKYHTQSEQNHQSPSEDETSCSAETNEGSNIKNAENNVKRKKVMIKSSSESDITKISTPVQIKSLTAQPSVPPHNKSREETNISAKIVPGVKTYNKAHIRTTLILSDSTLNRIPTRHLKANIDMDCEDVIRKIYPGNTAEEISHNSILPLNNIRPEQVVIVAGTNDISRGQRDKTVNEYKVVDNILSIARRAKAVGTKKVFISSILVRWGYNTKNIIVRVNNLLENMCREEGFLFLDHSDITTRHICHDGLHPNDFGYVILKMNILKCFYSFNPFLCNFIDFYEKALF